MAITFTLVSVGPSHLTYLASSGGTTAAEDTGTIQAAGAGDADVAMEDAVVAGLVKQIVDVDFAGFGTQEARDIGLDFGFPSNLEIANVPGHRLRAAIAGQSGLKNWRIEADTSVTDRLEYNVACTAAGAATALIHLEAVGTPGKY